MRSLIVISSIILCFQLSSCGHSVVIADFEGSDYRGWTASGEAFGSGPAVGALEGQPDISGFRGEGFANSGNGGIRSTGTLESTDFSIERNYINFLRCGGNLHDKIKVELIVDSVPVREWSRNHQYAMQWITWDVQNLQGK